MQPYHFRVVHIPGPKNIADSLYRMLSGAESHACDNNQVTEQYVRFVSTSATPRAMTVKERSSAEDEELVEVRECIESGKWQTCHK